MARPVELRADLAPIPAMERAVELIEMAGMPRHEHVQDALRELRSSLRQMRLVADMEKHPDERAGIRAILGADFVRS